VTFCRSDTFLRIGVALVKLAALERSFYNLHRVASQPLDAVAPDHRMISMTRRFGVKVGSSPPMGSRGSNTENQRNDLIRHDCGTIASPGRSVTICIHDYRPRRAWTEERKKILNSSSRGGSRRDAKNVGYIRLHRYHACIYVFVLLPRAV